jgi:hypothetical protein
MIQVPAKMFLILGQIKPLVGLVTSRNIQRSRQISPVFFLKQELTIGATTPSNSDKTYSAGD